MKQTAVEWLKDKLKETYDKEGKLPLAYTLHLVEQAKQMEKEQTQITENTSDGYHTFKELYEFRKVYNAALFNEWAKSNKYDVHKSWKHNDGEICFGGGWFIVVALLPNGQISNHYEAKDWDLFNIPETEKALFEFDGHTAQDVLNRIKTVQESLFKDL
jgi:hypothetical protein